MWIIVNFKSNGDVIVIENNLTTEKVISLSPKYVDDSNSLILWDIDYPESKSEMNELMKQIFDLNIGKVFKIFPNAKINLEFDTLRCRCPRRCFCQWEGNSCTCWTSYCRPNGCVWKRCPGSC